MTKTIAIVTAIVIVLCAVTAFVTAEVVNYQQTELYPMTAVVINTDLGNDAVVCEDYNGNLWEFYGVEDWEHGDIAALIMDTCNTPTIYDDEIVDVRYCGNIEGLD